MNAFTVTSVLNATMAAAEASMPSCTGRVEPLSRYEMPIYFGGLSIGVTVLVVIADRCSSFFRQYLSVADVFKLLEIFYSVLFFVLAVEYIGFITAFCNIPQTDQPFFDSVSCRDLNPTFAASNPMSQLVFDAVTSECSTLKNLALPARLINTAVLVISLIVLFVLFDEAFNERYVRIVYGILVTNCVSWLLFAPVTVVRCYCTISDVAILTPALFSSSNVVFIVLFYMAVRNERRRLSEQVCGADEDGFHSA